MWRFSAMGGEVAEMGIAVNRRYPFFVEEEVRGSYGKGNNRIGASWNFRGSEPGGGEPAFRFDRRRSDRSSPKNEGWARPFG